MDWKFYGLEEGGEYFLGMGFSWTGWGCEGGRTFRLSFASLVTQRLSRWIKIRRIRRSSDMRLEVVKVMSSLQKRSFRAVKRPLQ